MRKIIIDTDPGIDDAIAMLYAFSHKDIEILGITSVAGNKGLDTTTNNAARISTYFGSKVKVYKGAASKMEEINMEVFDKNSDKNVHGNYGLGSANLDLNNEVISDISAIDFILDTIKENPNEVDIIALGPLTNIALCIEKDYETMKKVKSIHSMGGSVFTGNVTPVAEFNYWFDAKAVDIVFSKLGSFIPIYMVGLDATAYTLMDFNDIAYIKLIGNDLSKLIADDLLGDYVKYFWTYLNTFGVVIHDLVTMIGYMNTDIYTKLIHANLRCVTDSDIANGQCIVDLVDSWKLEKNAYVPMAVDKKLFMYEFVKVLFGESYADKYLDIIGG